jgi:acyl-coenzyme A thioesterase PaaI-like protein
MTATDASFRPRGAGPGALSGLASPVPSDPHPNCVVCGRKNRRGLRLDFKPASGGGVEVRFDCSPAFEGYPKQLHGGVIAMLLDGAMTNCLFRYGHVGVTGELTIRYRHPVAVDRIATVRAWIQGARPPLLRVAAELVQGGRVMAIASAKFFDRPPPAVVAAVL